MELLVGLLLGIVVTFIIKGKSFKIEIFHKYDPPPIPVDTEPVDYDKLKEDQPISLDNVVIELQKLMGVDINGNNDSTT